MEIHENFGMIDWVIVFGYLALTTFVGHLLRGKQSTIKDFFLGGKSLPWPAVSGSIIATEISALTFIGVPGTVFALQGDFTYLQWGLGSIVARFIVGIYLVPIYYEREIFSPYDYMGNRLGEGVKKLVTILFSLGSILGQGVRVLVTALILQVVTGMEIHTCIIIIGAFAVLWTLMGGMRTVIWTDVIQFGIFIIGGILALAWLINAVGWESFVSINSAVTLENGETISKFNALNLTSPFEDPLVGYTIWVAIFAMPFQNLAAYGTDQLNAQRMFCCASKEDARKAIIWSSVSQVITLLMLMVGTGLFAWYAINKPTAVEAEWFAKDNNYVFPIWIVTELPTGIKGLIIAGAFAAAVSSLDSILAALSQTSLSAYFGKEYLDKHSNDKSMVTKSRILVLVWGVLLSLFAIFLAYSRSSEEDKDLIFLAFRMVAYVYGPLLGILILAITPWRKKASFHGILIGTMLSIALAAWALPDIYNLLVYLDFITVDQIKEIQPKIGFFWLYPINVLVTVLCGLLIPGKNTTPSLDETDSIVSK